MKLFQTIMDKAREKGTTIMELLLYVAIFSMLLTVLTEIFSSVLSVQKEYETVTTVEEDARFILSRLSYDITRADLVVDPPDLGNSSNTLHLKINGIDYIYNIAGGDLELTNDTGTDKLNSFDSVVSNLSFLRIGNVSGKPTVRTNFTLTSKTVRTKGPEVRTFTTTFGLR